MLRRLLEEARVSVEFLPGLIEWPDAWLHPATVEDAGEQEWKDWIKELEG